MKMKKSNLFCLLVFCCATHFANAQVSTVTMQAKCGDKFEGEFRVQHEQQEIKIPLGAGDILELSIVPLGDYLKIRYQLCDPSGALLVDDYNGMFGNDKKSLEINTGVLSANGAYTIKIRNDSAYNSNDTMVGVYTVYVKCTKRNGQVIEPE